MKLTRWLPRVERLEAREVPAVTAALSQVANWTELGPNVVSNGQVRGLNSANPNGGAAVTNAVIGAISTLAPHPTDPNIMFAGAPNGGVWRTFNAQSANPTWTPLTDQLASMSVADITFDPTNLNRVVVSIGATADGGEAEPSGTVRGDRVGLLVTDDALATTPTWRIVGGPLAGRDVVKAAVRGVNWTVATTSGLYVSVDNGVTFTNTLSSSINNGLTYQPRPFTSRVYDMALNPRLVNQLYVATEPFAGLGRQVWRSDDFGVTWGSVTDPQMQLSTNTTSVKLSVRDTASNDNQIYVATVNTLPTPFEQRVLPGPTSNITLAWQNRNNILSSICWSTNQGGNWTRMDQPRRMTAPEGLDLFQRRDGDPFQGGGLRADGTRVLVVTDEVRNNQQFGDGFPHRLQTGDLVYIEGVVEFPLTVPPAVPPNNPIFDRGQGAFYFVEVRDEYSFWLLGATAPGELMDSRQVFWQRTVDATPGEAGFMDIAAAPSTTVNGNANQSLLYLGGDFSQFRFTAAGTPLSAGLSGPFPTTFTGSVWQGNRFTVPQNFGNVSTQWANLTDTAAGNTAPGGDTREMVFDATGNLWVATGTGIYRRGTAANQPWTTANGNIRVGQFWGVGYDTRNNLVAGATQDTGIVEQATTGGLTYQSVLTNTSNIVRDPGGALPNFTADVRNFYTDQQYAYEVAVDNTSNPNRSIRYFASSSFGQLNQLGGATSFVPGVIRRIYDTAGNLLQTSALRFASALTTAQPISGIAPADVALSRVTNGRMDTSARIVMELNANDATRGVYGLTRVYEDSDPLGPGSSPETGFVVSDVTPRDSLGNIIMTGRVRAMAYGGKRAGISFNQVLFVGTTTGQLWIRGEFGPTFNQAAPGTGAVTDILQDPDDYRHAFVAQGGQVYETRDLGATWTNLSASQGGRPGLVDVPDPLTGLPANGALTTQIFTIALFDPNPGTANVGAAGDVVLLAGGRGGVFRRSLSVCGFGVWSEYGNGMPNSVVTDLEVVGSRLVAGTFGRGVWTIPDVTQTLTQTLFLDIDGDAAANTISIAADPLDQNAVIVSDGSGLNQKFTFGQFDQIRVRAFGGGDTVTVGNAGGSTRFVNYPINIDLGGDAGDTLIVDSSGSTAAIRATITPTTIGAAVGDTIFSGCGSITYTGLVAGGVLDLRTGSGDDSVIVDAGGYPHPILTNTAAGNDVLFLSAASSASVFATDAAGGADTIQVSVPAGVTVFGSPANVITAANLTVTSFGGFETYNLIGEGTGAAVSWGGGNLNDDFFLTADPTAGVSRLTINSQLTPAAVASQVIRFVNMNALTVSTLAGNDRLIVGSVGVGPGSTSFVNYLINANLGGDAGDTLIVDTNSTTTPVVASVSPSSIGAAPGDTIFGANGRILYSGLVAGGALEIRTGSGNDQLNIYGGTYPFVINAYTGAGDDTVLIDGSMAGTVNAIDTAGTNDVVQVLVPSGGSIFGSPSRVFAVNNLRVGASAGIDSYLFTGLGTGGYMNWDGSGQDDDFFLTADGSGVPGESQLIAFTPNTTTLPQRARFTNMLAVSVSGGAGNDRLIIDSNGPQPGSSAKFVTYHVNAFLGGDAADALIVDDSSTTTATRTTVTGNSVAAQLGVDTLFGTNGRLFYTGAKTLHLFNGVGNDVVVYDTSTALTAYQFGGLGSNLALISGSGGDDTVNVYPTIPALAVNSLLAYTFGVQRFQVVGNGGTDRVNVRNLAANTSLVVNQSEVQSGEVGGTPVQVAYQSTEELNLFAGGGTNNLLWQDVSNNIYGSPTVPGQGVEFFPRGPVSGTIRLAGGAGTGVNFHAVNGEFKVNGDANSTNTGDVLSVYGVSTTGQAAFGESTSSNGSDTIVASEDGVTVNNAILGELRSVVLGRTANNQVGFGTVWVRGGNESGVGDSFTAVPTARTNLLLDGGDPSAAPGDSLTVLTTGGAFTSPSTDPAFGPPHTRITNRPNLASVGYLNFESVSAVTPVPGSPPAPSLGPVNPDLFAVGSEGLGQVKLYNLDGSLRNTLTPYADTGYLGPIRVAVGDVTGDGKSDVVVAPGPGSGVAPLVKVFNGQTGQLHYQFFAYPATFGGGVTLAVGYFNNDQFADIVTGAGPGGGPQVNVFDGGTNGILRAFNAFDATFTGGVNVGTGDTNRDGVSEIVTAPVGGSTLTRVYDGATNGLLRSFDAFAGFTGGVSVAAGDITGDGVADIITGAGPGGGAHVKAFDGVSGAQIRSFFVNDPNVPGAPPVSITGGVTVAASDINGDGVADILTGRGRGFSPFAQYFNGLTTTSLLAVDTFGGTYSNGIFVGA